MDEHTIARSKQYQQFRLVVVVTIGVFLVLLTFMLLRGVRQAFGMDMTTLGWVIRLIVVALTVGAIAIFRTEYRNKRYAVSGNKPIVTRYWLGTQKSKKIITINPQSVKMVSLRQGLVEKMFNSGTVEVEVDSRSQRDVYRLEHVDNPQMVLREIESYLRAA